jgi:hypothetical protein
MSAISQRLVMVRHAPGLHHASAINLQSEAIPAATADGVVANVTVFDPIGRVHTA